MIKQWILMAALAASLPAGADSLWPGGQSNSGNVSNLVTDKRALKVGDLVTVRIVEAASAQQDTNLKTQKQASVSGGAGVGAWGSSGVPLTSYGAGANENFGGGGS